MAAGGEHQARREPGWAYNPALDGVRGLAIVGVMARHAHLPYTGGGFLGVDAFFALSGFLITGLLLAEHDRFGRISLRLFYLRRFLRLYPALVVVLLVGTAVTLLDSRLPRANLTAVPFILLYVANWLAIIAHVTNPLAYYAHTWTLAVEEQFYLLWPLLVLFGLRLGRGRRPLVVAAVLIAGLSLVSRLTAITVPDGAQAYGTDGAAIELMFGCLLALLFWQLPEGGTAGRIVHQMAWPAVGVMLAILILDARMVTSGHARLDLRETAYDAVFTMGAATLIGHVFLAPMRCFRGSLRCRRWCGWAASPTASTSGTTRSFSSYSNTRRFDHSRSRWRSRCSSPCSAQPSALSSSRSRRWRFEPG